MLEAAESPIIRRLLVAFLAVSCPVVAGCDRIPGRGAAADATAAVADDAVVEEVVEPVEVQPSEPVPDRIYFTLTDYEWYARGEPLVFENAAYRAGSGVVAAPLSSMRKVGEYQGVDVYAADGADADTSVYVPVFPGYWQAFHLSEAVSPAARGS
jgi:hypothetical protein